MSPPAELTSEVVADLELAGRRFAEILAAPGACGLSNRECVARETEKLEYEADFFERDGNLAKAEELRQQAAYRKAYSNSMEDMATGARKGNWLTWFGDELKLALKTIGQLPRNSLPLAGGAGLWLVARSFNQSVYEYFNEPEQLVPSWVTGIGDYTGQAAAGAFLPFLIIGHFKPEDKRWRDAGDTLFAGVLVESAIVQGLKALELEERPNSRNRNGFPSGHSAVSFFTASVLCKIMGRKWCVAGYSTAAFVAFTRVASGWHTVGQVGFGAGIGMMTGFAAVAAKRAQDGKATRLARIFEDDHVMGGKEVHRSVGFTSGKTPELGRHSMATITFTSK